MAIVDVVKCEMTDVEFCRKFPSSDLRLGSQLVVHPSQKAFFVKGGKIYDSFDPGTYTLSTNNIPLLNAVVKLPFGGDTPFQAEVWFINLTTKLDMKWGTTSPVMLEDPKYNVIVPIRAYGQYGIKISNPIVFLTNIVGNMSSFSAFKLHEYFKGQLLMNLNNALSTKVDIEKFSILEINNHLLELSEHCEKNINIAFEKYGISLSDFTIMSINVPDNDPSVQKLKEAKDLAARLRITGRDIYQMERSFNVLDKAADNEGQGGSFASMGAGLGAGMGIGSTIGNIAKQAINIEAQTPPPLPDSFTYFIYMKGQQVGGQTFNDIKKLINAGEVSRDTLCWRQGMENWLKVSEMSEFKALFPPEIPPIPNKS